MSLAVLLLAAVPIVAEGKPLVRLEHDATPAAEAAAEVLQRHVVLLARTALPQQGDLPTLRFETKPFDGYRIESRDGGVVISGRFPIIAAYDLLRGWGCRFETDPPHLPQQARLEIEPRVWRNNRPLFVETGQFDPAMPATGISVRGLHRVAASAQGHALGHRVRVASTTFDDFLPVELFDKHPEYFALRRGARHPRGNFSLTNAEARRVYLDHVEAWLGEHPHVECLGLWPEVTSVWCEQAAANGHAESYALLWREAALRFPQRRFEILATGLTLKPPEGRVPKNIEVRLRPGRDASALQGTATQAIDAVIRAWKVRGARVLLEIDGAPESWCGLPWPNHEAIRADAQREWGAVLVHPDRLRATLWHDPKARVAIDEELAALLERARGVRSWGSIAAAAQLWPAAGPSPGARAGEVERLRSRAMSARRSEDATRAWFAYSALAHDLGAAYRRQMEVDMGAMLRELLPEGAVTTVGPATVREFTDRVIVETLMLRLTIERRTATVRELQRRRGTEWSEELLGPDARGFAVVALAEKSDRSAGEVRVRAGGDDEALVELGGRTHAGGSRWKSTLRLDGSSARVRQEASVEAAGGMAIGFRVAQGSWSEWVCPSYAREGRFEHPAERRQASFRIVPDEMVYVRRAARGYGIALRLPHGGVAAVVDGEDASLLTSSPGRRVVADWIVFAAAGELGK